FRPGPGEGEDRVAVAERVERLADQEERFLLHVDDAEPAADPAVGRRAHVDQEERREFAAGRALLDVEPVVDGAAGDPACERLDVRGEIDLRPVGPPRVSRPTGPEPFEATTERADQAGAALEHVADPARIARGRGAQVDDGARARIAADSPV